VNILCIRFFVVLAQHCGGDRPYIHPNQLDALHQEVHRQSIEKFCSARKMGGEEMSKSYQTDLDAEVQELYGECTVTLLSLSRAETHFLSLLLLVNYKKHNDSKNVFAFSRTPTTFISCMVLCYMIAGILDIIWLGGVNFVFMFAFWVCFVLLFVWLYTKYSGEYSEVGEYVDYFADVIWNNVSENI
jgi:atlastin